MNDCVRIIDVLGIVATTVGILGYIALIIIIYKFNKLNK